MVASGKVICDGGQWKVLFGGGEVWLGHCFPLPLLQFSSGVGGRWRLAVCLFEFFNRTVRAKMHRNDSLRP